MLPHHQPDSRPMQDACRVIAAIKAADFDSKTGERKVAVFVHSRLDAAGYRVTPSDCTKSRWKEVQDDAIYMRRCAGVYRLPITPEEIADDLVALGLQ